MSIRDALRNYARERAWPIAREAFSTYFKIGASELAAAFAYYAFFSIFPFLALLLWAGSLAFDPRAVAETVHEYFPMGGDTSHLVWEGVRQLQASHGTVNAAFVVVFLWASLRFFHALVHGVHLAWCERPMEWWRLPLKNLLMVLTVASAMVLGVLAPILLQVAHKVLVAMQGFLHFHFPEFDLPGYLKIVDWTRLALGSTVLFYAFAVLYMAAPKTRVRFRQVWLQALAVSVLIQILQTFFVNYLPLFLKYNVIYGTMGGVMFLLMWIYLSGLIILAGACWCSASAKVRGLAGTRQ